MIEASMRPLRFPSNFFASDLYLLSEGGKNELVDFLRKLQDNPFSPSILDESEERKGYYAKQVGDFVVYWTVGKSRVKSSELAPIDVLKVAPVSELQAMR